MLVLPRVRCSAKWAADPAEDSARPGRLLSSRVSDRSLTLDLRELDGFGGIDADADALLASCFQDHPAYLDALGHRRFLVIGRKGSGKTAICRQLITRKQHDHFAYGYTYCGSSAERSVSSSGGARIARHPRWH